MKASVPRSVLKAISSIMDEAIENACSCNANSEGSGYLGHERGCWIHIGRDKYQRVQRFLDAQRKKTP